MNACFRKPAGEAKKQTRRKHWKTSTVARTCQSWSLPTGVDFQAALVICTTRSWSLEPWSWMRWWSTSIPSLSTSPSTVSCVVVPGWSLIRPSTLRRWRLGSSERLCFAKISCFFLAKLCPFELADVQLAGSAIYARIPQNTPEYPRYTCPHQGTETTNYIRLLSIGYFIPLYPRGARFVWSILDHCYNVSMYTTVFRTPSTKYSLIFISHIYTIYILYSWINSMF